MYKILRGLAPVPLWEFIKQRTVSGTTMRATTRGEVPYRHIIWTNGFVVKSWIAYHLPQGNTPLTPLLKPILGLAKGKSEMLSLLNRCTKTHVHIVMQMCSVSVSCFVLSICTLSCWIVVEPKMRPVANLFLWTTLTTIVHVFLHLRMQIRA